MLMNLPFLKPLKTKLGFSLALFATFTLFQITNARDNYPNIDYYERYFREEIEGYSNFRVLPSTYAEFNPIGGIADGRYKLKSYKITRIRDNIYNLSLTFRKKKGIFKFYEKVDYPFYYDGFIIAFKTPKGKYKYRLKPITEPKKGVNFQFVNIVLPAQNRGKVHLKMRIYVNPNNYYRYYWWGVS